MTNTELVKAVADQTGLPQKKVFEVLQAVKDEIVTTLDEGGDVRISGLGTFKCKETKERKVNVPLTGEVVIPAGSKPSFKFSRPLYDFLRK